MCFMTPLPPLIGSSEAARLLCVDRDTIRRWAKTGKLNSIKMPSGTRKFRRADIEEILSGEVRPNGVVLSA
jgi:excisionase family DNA binding protein